MLQMDDRHAGELFGEMVDKLLLQCQRFRAPPGEDDALPLGAPLAEDVAEDVHDDGLPELVVVGGGQPRGGVRAGHALGGVGGERRVEEQHALGEHGGEPLRGLHDLLLLEGGADLGDGGGHGDGGVSPAQGGLGDGAHAGDLAEARVGPRGEGVVQHGDAGGGLHAGVGVLAEDDDAPFAGEARLQGLEDEGPPGHHEARAVGAHQHGGQRLAGDGRHEQRGPRLSAAAEELGQLEGVWEISRKR